MTRDPIRRRFGHGAARLRIGAPPDAERLSALARTPIRHERKLTLVPFATAAMIVYLLATSPIRQTTPLDPAATEEIQIVLESWSVPQEPLPARPLPEPMAPERMKSRRSPAPADSLATARPAPALRGQESERIPTPTREAPFDPTALATSGAHWKEGDALASADYALDSTRQATVAESVRAASARLARADEIRAMPSALATVSRAPKAGAPLVDPSSGSTPSTPLAVRPGATGSQSDPDADLVSAAARGTGTRRAFLATLERDAIEAGSEARAPGTTDRRPKVSASRPGAALLDVSSRGSALDGWREVPLDELPDCDPPGRQDLLKKRILLAAAVQRECSHPSGSYRFVETRNLGAFLMWSRPNPSRTAGQARDRDACDVLERALACLGDPSSQESKSR
jgi:hypothetical protein